MFPSLVARYERKILYYLHRLVGPVPDRDDLLQELWIKVFLRIHTLNTPEAFRVWLYKIAHDIAISYLRRKISYREEVSTEASLEELADATDSPELELLERAEMVHGALQKLSLSHREVLTLRFLESLDLNEIAQVVGCGVGTVKSRLHYAKLALRPLLEGSEND